MSAAYRVCNSNHAAKVLQRQNLLSVFVTFCHFPSLFGVICHFLSLFVTFCYFSFATRYVAITYSHYCAKKRLPTLVRQPLVL